MVQLGGAILNKRQETCETTVKTRFLCETRLFSSRCTAAGRGLDPREKPFGGLVERPAVYRISEKKKPNEAISLTSAGTIELDASGGRGGEYKPLNGCGGNDKE